MVRPKQVNLISAEVLRKTFPRKIKRKHFSSKTFLGLLTLAVVAFGFYQGREMVAVNMKLAEAKYKLQQAKTKLSQMRSQVLQFEKQKAELAKEEKLRQDRLDFLLSTSSQQTNNAVMLSMLAGLVPEDLWVNRFAVEGNEVRIVGLAMNPQLVTKFMGALNGSGYFVDSHFNSSEKQMLQTLPVHAFEISTRPLWNKFLKERARNGS